MAAMVNLARISIKVLSSIKVPPSLVVVVACSSLAAGQIDSYPHNAVTCERCHNTPSKFGGSPMTVERVGQSSAGKFVPSSEGGIHHRHGESSQSSDPTDQISGERVSLNLLGDGYIEAIDSRDIEQNAKKQRQTNLRIAGVAVNAPLLEASGSPVKIQTGRFGWKSQHSSLMSSCADSLRNELGIRNRLYPDEYPTHALTDSPTPLDIPNATTHKTELESFVNEIRHAPPPRATTASRPRPTHRQERGSSKRSAAPFATSRHIRRSNRARESMVEPSRSQSSSAIRSFIPIATSCCTM